MFWNNKKPTNSSSANKKTSRSRSKPAAPAANSERLRSASNQLTATPELEEQIRERAYQLFLERGGQGGNAEQDWLRAEAELRGGHLT